MIEFQVKDMSCGGCIKAVTKSVQALDASAQVEVDLGQQRVRIQSSADPAALQAAIVGAGFPVLGSS
jgi:copper chaperone